jgi:hypothetical protein
MGMGDGRAYEIRMDARRMIGRVRVCWDKAVHRIMGML